MYFFFTECEKEALQEKVVTLQETSCQLQEGIRQLEAQLSDTNLCLDKENARYHSACRQQQVSVAALQHVRLF